ncbi:MAG: hypothetical protein GY862_28265 [Gammaproteobacteria bacterium]|nr:hypothetical protein [Gammaproteobacteria bacterium]
MRQITWNELSKCPVELLEWIQHGNSLRVYQEGRPVADVVPFKPPKQPAWKRPVKRITLPLAGGEMSTEILRDRDDTRA